MTDDDADSDTKMVLVHGEIDLRDWNWKREEDPKTTFHDRLMLKGFAAQFTEVMKEQFEEDPPRLYLPFLYAFNDSDGCGGKAPDDPAMIYVRMQLGPNEEGVIYGLSLANVVNDLLDAVVAFDTKMVADARHISACSRIAARLRDLASRLEDACAAPPTTGE